MSDSNIAKVIRFGDQKLFIDFRRTMADGNHAVLFVHGFPLNHQLWRHQLDELSKTHSVLAIDLPGYGQSGPILDGTSISNLADLLGELVFELEIAQVTFCGLSMGGYIGWQFWKMHQDKLARLICCNTRASADDEVTRRARIQSALTVERNGIQHAAETMLPKLFSPTTQENRPEIIAEVDQMIRRTSTNGFACGQYAMKDRADATPWLSQIDVPTLVIAGSDDTITPPEEMKAMADEIKDSVFVEIEDTGHLSPLENPKPFNLALKEFLA